MPVKSSGELSLTTDIVGEFGGTAPHGMSEYYRGGGNVPDVAANNGVAASGEISFSSFYDATAFGPIAATGGSTSTYVDGDYTYKVHTFTSSGSFSVTDVGTIGTVDIVLAGGGGGASQQYSGNWSGGGGGGGVLYGTGKSVSATNYGITIGGGGVTSNAQNGFVGSNSNAFSGTAYGGGGGGGERGVGHGGGCGGGSGGNQTSAGGSANQNSNGGMTGYGTNGGAGGGFQYGGGGGGGAGQAGQPGQPSTPVGGDGGQGVGLNVTGSTSYYAPGAKGRQGGQGGHGNEGYGNNYGRGGYGAQNGYSGVCVVRYRSA